MTNIDELKQKMRDEGANDDTAHEVLGECAQLAVDEVITEDTTDEERESLINAYIQGFCESEGYSEGK